MADVVAMLALVTLVLLCMCYLIMLMVRSEKLKHIPGPDAGSLLFGHALSINFDSFHRTLADWSRIYGHVYKLRLLHKHVVVVSGQEELHETLVKKGVETGGRFNSFRLEYIMENTGIVPNLEPDAKWKALRKISQRHLKQFGDGMSRLEQLIASVGDDMLEKFSHTQGAPCDPKEIVLLTAIKSMSFLITGQRASDDDPLLKIFQGIDAQVQQLASLGNPTLIMYDLFPWLRFLRLRSWDHVQDLVESRDRLWDRIKQVDMDNPRGKSLAKLMLSHVSPDEAGNHGNLTEKDASITCTNLLIAGVGTTTYTLYALINLLAHNPSVQEKIYQEMCSVLPHGLSVTIANKPRMPYTNATLLEALRYISTAPLSIIHRSLSDVELFGFFVPKNTLIITNLWALHHDPDVWGDPERFRPERFLDDDGHLVPADHIYRKNLMPFGAGTRVCVGESLAIARLFIWTARLVQRFDIVPAEGNDLTLTQADSYLFEGVVSKSMSYRVEFSERNVA